MFRTNRQAGFRTAVMLSEPPPSGTSLAESWNAVPCVERGFRTVDHLQAPRDEDNAFAAWFDAEALSVLVRAEITATKGVRSGVGAPGTERIAMNDSFEVMIDPAHDHETYLYFNYDSSGLRRAARRRWLHYTLRCDYVDREIEPVPDGAWALINETAAGVWYSLVRVPFRLLGLKGPEDMLAWGFNIVQRRWINDFLIESAWSPVPGQTHSPWDFGELMAPGVSMHPEVLDFGELIQDENALNLRLRNRTPDERMATAELHTWCEGHDERCTRIATLSPGGTVDLRLPFVLDDRVWRRQEIELTVLDGTRPVYRACYSGGHSPGAGGGCMTYKNGVRWLPENPPEDPRPDDPDFHHKKRRFILSRLPDFPEMGWWGGPRGDWLLRDRRGSDLTFNLLSDGLFGELGDWIAGCFPTDEDRVIAAALLTHRLMIYSPHGSRAETWMGPLGSLRHGATICSGFTCAANGILAALPRTDGLRGYRSWHTHVSHHVILSVELPAGYRTLVDPTLGGFFFTRDRSRLATEEELAADPELCRAALHDRDKDYAPDTVRDHGWYGVLPYPPPDRS